MFLGRFREFYFRRFLQRPEEPELSHGRRGAVLLEWPVPLTSWLLLLFTTTGAGGFNVPEVRHAAFRSGWRTGRHLDGLREGRRTMELGAFPSRVGSPGGERSALGPLLGV